MHPSITTQVPLALNMASPSPLPAATNLLLRLSTFLLLNCINSLDSSPNTSHPYIFSLQRISSTSLFPRPLSNASPLGVEWKLEAAHRSCKTCRIVHPKTCADASLARCATYTKFSSTTLYADMM
ncbi:hypothetical protein CALCODRAFT_148624 [Calocera cornea HHB12733]|uniref:Uncharacterized protein n=1 Tax=Calocera cornea HHB12733 TaxID=1353952 RepID=A0A165CPV2_9BASI|nr:hypothetical protein CALCODRAFT_148624 [Calocera cornea HHB12733]